MGAESMGQLPVLRSPGNAGRPDAAPLRAARYVCRIGGITPAKSCAPAFAEERKNRLRWVRIEGTRVLCAHERQEQDKGTTDW